jgi:predicted ATPase
VDQRAAEFLRRRFELEPAGARVLDRVYRVRGVGRTEFEMGGRSLSPFVGRNQDLSALQELLRRGEEGRGQVVGIVGEPGVGKSRLLHEFRQSLIPGRVTYLEGRCLSYGHTTPYLPIIDIIRSNFGLVEADSTKVMVEKVRLGLAALAMDPKTWAPVLLHLLGCQEVADYVATLSPEAVKERTIEGLRQMAVLASRRRPIVFVIEDLQWIDRNSEDTLLSLAETLSACPILLLATYRPGYRPPWLNRSCSPSSRSSALPAWLWCVRSVRNSG